MLCCVMTCMSSQYPLCYHPAIEYQLDGPDPEGAPPRHGDIAFGGLLIGNTRRERILKAMEAAGLSVVPHWNLVGARDVHETKRTGDIVLNMHQQEYSDCKLEVGCHQSSGSDVVL
jgi:hypothetical protein